MTTRHAVLVTSDGQAAPQTLCGRRTDLGGTGRGLLSYTGGCGPCDRSLAGHQMRRATRSTTYTVKEVLL
jgi:hypothetical protein